MDIKSLLLELGRISDCSLLDPKANEAAKVAALILSEAQNLLGLDPQAAPKDIAMELFTLVLKSRHE